MVRKAHRGKRRIAPLILILDSRWKWMVIFTPRPLYPKESTETVPIEHEAGGPKASLRVLEKRQSIILQITTTEINKSSTICYVMSCFKHRFTVSDIFALPGKIKVYILQILLTYLLTPWSRVLLEKLTGSQLVKKFPAFYGNWRFITAFTSARQVSLYWAFKTYSAT